MKGWYGDSMKHSLASRGITTSQYIRTHDKDRAKMRLQAIQERQNYLSQYHSDWFIDKLMLYKPSEFNKTNWLSLDKRNRDLRLKESIGKRVFVGFGYVVDEMYGIEGILRDIGKNYVTVEIDGDDLKVRDFTIRYIERAEPLKPKKPRKTNIPKGEFRFMLKEDTTNSEVYEALPEEFEGCKVIPVVSMWYNKKWKYWGVSYRFLYGDKYGYSTPSIKSVGQIEKRREARRLAMSMIDRASEKDFIRLEPYQKQEIKRGCRLR